MTDDAPGDALRLIEGPELDDLVGERRKCSACGADDMRAVRFEETANNFYLTFQCPHCDNSVLIESPGMAGVRAALYFLIGAAYLAALKLFDIEIGATGVAIFSIVAVIAVWNAFCIIAPHYEAPRTSQTRFDAAKVTGEAPPPLTHIVARVRYLKYDSFWGGFLAALAAIAAAILVVGAVSRLFGG